jgi:uncharacterized protein
MLHTFEFSHRGVSRYYLFESENSSLLEIERPVFLYVKNEAYELTKKNEPADEADKLTDKERAEFDSLGNSVKNEIADELNELKRRGIIGVKENKIDIKKSGFIKSMCLNVCHDCNLRCVYCFAAQGTYENEERRKIQSDCKSEKFPKTQSDCKNEKLLKTQNDCESEAFSKIQKKIPDCEEKYMSLKTAFEAVDFLIAASGPRRNLEIDFFGGEPLMNFGVVKKTVEYARKKCAENGKKIGFTMTTNGLLLNKKTAEYLNENMDNVVISIDGRREVHNALRKTAGGVGSFDAVLKNAKEFRGIRGSKRYYIRGTYTKKNLDFGEDILFLNDCGFDQLSIEPVVLESGDPLSIRPSDTEKIKAEYERFASEYLERRKTSKWFNFFHFMIDLDKGPCVYKRLNGCGAGDEYAAVTPSGDIYPCHQFIGKPEFRMGNVADAVSYEKRGEKDEKRGIKSVEKDVKRVEKNGVKVILDERVREKFQKSTVYTKDKCGKCFAKFFCSGGCAANSVTYENDIDKTNEVYCGIMRKRLELSLAIRAEEKKAER